MGMFFPCLVAAVLNGGAFQIFREPMKMGNGPLMALYMFIFTTFMLLWSVRLYPRNLRRIGKLQFIIEFLAAEFLMEDLIIDFWFPLEKCVIESLPQLAQNIEDWLATGDWSADVITDVLKDEMTGFYASYTLATFFLIATLHASRAIDLRTLTQEGPTCFFKEILHRIKINGRRLLRKFGLGKRKVKINEQRNTHRPCGGGFKPKPVKAKSNRKISFAGGNNGCKQFCPVHDHLCDDDDDTDDSGLDDFEDLGKISDLDCT